jgi:hypothetical protein
VGRAGVSTAIVIAANGLAAMSSACLESLDAHTQDYRLFFYDRVPREELTAVWNDGVTAAKRFGCDTTVICNNDVLFSPGWLPPLLDLLDVYTAIGPVTNKPGHQPLQRGQRDEPERYQKIAWSGGEIDKGGVALNGFCFASLTNRFFHTPFDEERYTFLGSEDYWMREAERVYGMPFAIARHSYVHHHKAATRNA